MNHFLFSFHRSVILILSALLVACTTLPVSFSAPGNPPVNEKNQTQHVLWEQFQTKKPYSGPIRFAIQTNLLHSQVQGQQIDLTQQLDTQGFQTQAVPQGPVVYQETFTQEGSVLEIIRGFRAADPSKRYTLHVQAHSPLNSQSQLTININGYDWLTQAHFAEQEAQRAHLLLNANNSLRLHMAAQPGMVLTVTLVEGGAAGTILRPQGRIGMPGDTQATHVQRNDVNIFNPNDPDSLGGLEPYQRPFLPEDAPPDVTGVSVDGGAPVQFEVGTLILRLREPDYILPILQNQYGATVIHKLETPNHPDLTYYYLQFDLAKSPVANAGQLIRAYRDKIPAEFNEFVFASSTGLQTFVLLMDLLVNYEPYIATWELNYYTPAPLEEPKFNDWGTQNYLPVSTNNRAWWLRDTFVREAWNFSIGTGVNVAYIDRGFIGVLNGSIPHPEYGNRLKSAYSGQSQNIVLTRRPKDVGPLASNVMDCLPQPDKETYCNQDHGGTTAMAGFAQRNNGIGTVGIAPNANIIPFATDGYIFTYAWALNNIYTDVLVFGKRYDVIGYNMQEEVPLKWKSPPPYDPGNDPQSQTALKTAVALVTVNLGIPMIVAAGNQGSYCAGRKTDSLGVCEKEYQPSVFNNQKTPLPGDNRTIQLIIAGGALREGIKPYTGAFGNHTTPNPTQSEIRSWGTQGNVCTKTVNTYIEQVSGIGIW